MYKQYQGPTCHEKQPSEMVTIRISSEFLEFMSTIPATKEEFNLSHSSFYFSALDTRIYNAHTFYNSNT
jgi:hypothetical protein